MSVVAKIGIFYNTKIFFNKLVFMISFITLHKPLEQTFVLKGI